MLAMLLTLDIALLAGAPSHDRAPPSEAPLAAEVARRSLDVQAKVIRWRRTVHQDPELGNREFKTARLVADHLRALGLEVRTGVAHTGVVGVLRGGSPGRVVALRADMDALPVTEETPLPFASKVRTTWQGREVGVAHACGHDAHTAILMGVAEVLAGMRTELRGTVKFLFQPAEEGPPAGEEGGAALMVKEGALESPRPDAIFGLHVTNRLPVGRVATRAGPYFAAGDELRIVVRGRGTHGAKPWAGVDPVVVAAQVVLAMQTIPSRQVDVTQQPVVVTVATIHGGDRPNVIPDTVELTGTVRTFDEATRADVRERIRSTAEHVALSAGATAEVTITPMYRVLSNDEALARASLPVLARAAGGQVTEDRRQTISEDFSEYSAAVPGFFFYLGVTPPGTDPLRTAPNHSPRFLLDEAALALGVRALALLAVEHLEAGGPR